ncbi:chitin-binding domain protein cbd-1-like [Spodoptera frugiperda]|uniref:Chitin-binding domain protein cbd-1-like n=1 Tax=Spodoptera frugiperda TaxID=7108 RepID=A0A9R0E3T7_SPOFR|nr:chitin-binding domain protein cbd-1-like [Spodoptera frugiperda]
MYAALTFLSLVLGSPDQNLPNGCPASFNVSVLKPHETDCSKFYICNNGEKVEMNCAPGTLFDVKIRVCNLPFAVDCKNSTSNSNSTSISTSTPISTSISTPRPRSTSAPSTTEKWPYFDCPPDPTNRIIQMPHKTDCVLYYKCSNAETRVLPCSRGKLFDYKRKRCVPAQLATCYQEPTTKRPTTKRSTTKSATTPSTTETMPDFDCAPDSTGKVIQLPHETDCGLYYICSNAQTLEMRCSHGKLFDYKRQICVIAQLATCYPEATTEGSTTPPTSIAISDTTELLPNGCPQDYSVDYLLPDENNCSRYYKCVYGGKIFMECKHGTLFDHIFKTCLYLATCYPGATTPPTYSMALRRKGYDRYINHLDR